MNASLSFQDCERKAPAVNYPVTFLDAKPSGIDFKFSKGPDLRTRRPYVYTVFLTPATKSGEWTSADDKGAVEQVVQTKLPQGYRIEGIWIEAGERRIVVFEYA